MSAFGIAHHEIVGYCTGHEFVCTGCVGDADDTDDCTPIFAGDEDAELPCDECGESLIDSYAGRPDGTGSEEKEPEVREETDDEINERFAAMREKEREEALDEEIKELEEMLTKLKAEKEKKA